MKGDSRLRLLNYQNNLISKITNLANLSNLIFLDLYNNLIDTLEGPLSTMSSLRVVMVGKNRIEKVKRRSAPFRRSETTYVFIGIGMAFQRVSTWRILGLTHNLDLKKRVRLIG